MKLSALRVTATPSCVQLATGTRTRELSLRCCRPCRKRLFETSTTPSCAVSTGQGDLRKPESTTRAPCHCELSTPPDPRPLSTTTPANQEAQPAHKTRLTTFLFSLASSFSLPIALVRTASSRAFLRLLNPVRYSLRSRNPLQSVPNSVVRRGQRASVLARVLVKDDLLELADLGRPRRLLLLDALPSWCHSSRRW